MAHTLTDGELEILADLAHDYDDADLEEGPEFSGDWCHGCDNPVEECHCRPLAATPGRTPLERAVNKAMALGTPAYRVDDRTYTVPASDGMAAYIVLVNGTDYACTCPAGESGRICYHIGAVMMAVAARKLAPVMDARLLEPNRTPSRSPLWAKAA